MLRCSCRVYSISVRRLASSRLYCPNLPLYYLVVDRVLEVVDEYQVKINKLERDILLHPVMDSVRSRTYSYFSLFFGAFTLYSKCIYFRVTLSCTNEHWSRFVPWCMGYEDMTWNDVVRWPIVWLWRDNGIVIRTVNLRHRQRRGRRRWILFLCQGPREGGRRRGTWSRNAQSNLNRICWTKMTMATTVRSRDTSCTAGEWKVFSVTSRKYTWWADFDLIVCLD